MPVGARNTDAAGLYRRRLLLVRALLGWQSVVMITFRALAVIAVLFNVSAARGQDWSNAGGNAGRNGSTGAFLPLRAEPVWTLGRNSIIAWQPVIEGSRVFMIRQTGFPPESTGSPVVAMDLDTGAELWARNIPAQAGDWTTWIAGVKNGRVFAGRSGNGASVLAKLHCLDAATGTTLWQSVDRIDAGAYDGVVFAENGDPIIAGFRNIRRIRASDGATVWTAVRTCSVSGNCGGAVFGNAVYVADAVSGGHSIKKFDLSTGALMYQSPVMAGFTIQTTPMVGPDGSVYLNRVQNNAAVDFFYTFTDTGSGLVQRWRVESRYTYASEFAATTDSVFVVARDNSIRRLRAADGAEVSSTGVLGAPLSAPRMAVDPLGRLVVSNGEFPLGRVYCFNENLSERWSVAVQNVNIGAPAVGRDGTLVIAGIGSDVRAIRSELCPADFTADGFTDAFDYDAFVACFEGEECVPGRTADFDGDGFVDGFDYDSFVAAFESPC